MTRPEIQDKVLQALAAQAGVVVSALTLETALVDLRMDTLDVKELAIALEDQFKVELPAHVEDRWSTAQDVLDSVLAEMLVKD